MLTPGSALLGNALASIYTIHIEIRGGNCEMAPAVWNGLLRFGLLTIPVKLYRAAQAEQVSFGRYTSKRALAFDTRFVPTPFRSMPPRQLRGMMLHKAVPAKRKPTSAQAPLSDSNVQSSSLSYSDLAKGYEFAKGKYVCVSPTELAGLLPPTAREIDVREFVKPVEIEPVFIDSTFFVMPNRAGQQAYALLLEALCRSGLVGVAQVAMHSRESVLVLRPCGNSIIAQSRSIKLRFVPSGSIAPTYPWLRHRNSHWRFA